MTRKIPTNSRSADAAAQLSHKLLSLEAELKERTRTGGVSASGFARRVKRIGKVHATLALLQQIAGENEPEKGAGVDIGLPLLEACTPTERAICDDYLGVRADTTEATATEAEAVLRWLSDAASGRGNALLATFRLSRLKTFIQGHEERVAALTAAAQAQEGQAEALVSQYRGRHQRELGRTTLEALVRIFGDLGQSIQRVAKLKATFKTEEAKARKMGAMIRALKERLGGPLHAVPPPAPGALVDAALAAESITAPHIVRASSRRALVEQFWEDVLRQPPSAPGHALMDAARAQMARAQAAAAETTERMALEETWRQRRAAAEAARKKARADKEAWQRAREAHAANENATRIAALNARKMERLAAEAARKRQVAEAEAARREGRQALAARKKELEELEAAERRELEAKAAERLVDEERLDSERRAEGAALDAAERAEAGLAEAAAREELVLTEAARRFKDEVEREERALVEAALARRAAVDAAIKAQADAAAERKEAAARDARKVAGRRLRLEGEAAARREVEWRLDALRNPVAMGEAGRISDLARLEGEKTDAADAERKRLKEEENRVAAGERREATEAASAQQEAERQAAMEAERVASERARAGVEQELARTAKRAESERNASSRAEEVCLATVAARADEVRSAADVAEIEHHMGAAEARRDGLVPTRTRDGASAVANDSLPPHGSPVIYPDKLARQVERRAVYATPPTGLPKLPNLVGLTVAPGFDAQLPAIPTDEGPSIP